MINRITLLLLIGLAWGQRTTIALLEFEGKGVSQSETSTLTDRLRDEILKKGVYNVLERGLMDDVLKEQGFQQSGCVTSECAVEVGNMLGVQQMVGGSIGKVGNMYTVSARIIDVGTGEVLKSANYDLIGGIEELLMNGMNQVASELSGIRLNNRNTFSDKPITKDP
jgi:TolB-like protein